MSRPRVLVLVVAAWALPSAWTALALLSGPSDGTSLAGTRWGASVSVSEAYGDTPLRAGDTVLAIGGLSIDAAVTGDPPARGVGDEVAYEIRRPDEGLDRELTLVVPLQRYPVRAAVREELPVLALAAMPLAAASIALLRRPALASWAFLASASLGAAVVTANPLGLGAVDLAGGRGVWPYAGGQVACALALGCALLTAVAFTTAPGWLRRRPWTAALPLVLPLAAGVAWAAVAASRLEPGAARLQTLTSVTVPALVTCAPVAAGVLVHGLLRATRRQDRLALRLVLLSLAGGLGVRLLLVDVPERLGGDPILPWPALGLVLVPSVLACVVIALVRHRLDSVEPVVRRAVVQAFAAAVVGAVFVAAASTVDLAADQSFEDVVAGGVLALLLVPLALGLQRAVRRLVQGDRELTSKVVSDLRSIDPLTAPEEVLGETLALLSRRLHLSYAAIEVPGALAADSVATAIGEPRGESTTVDLRVAGTEVGRLVLEVDPDHSPFGTGDRRMLEDVGSQVGALVQAVGINRELQRSREALVAAREEERRRVRRDLHDGLGPSLATLAMGLESAQDLIARDPDRAAALVADLAEQAREEIAEVRRLVDGLRPPVLDQLGLVTALQQRAAEHNLAAASGGPGRMSWTVDADPDLEPLPAAIEVAAYRIVVEAVNNAARHSAASTCAVTLRRDPDWLRIRVCDSGVGLGPGRTNGVGLSSMRDRAEELGGTCTLSSAGTGTVVEARLPLRATGGAR